jgi:methyl-accepting chemotaxis protein
VEDKKNSRASNSRYSRNRAKVPSSYTTHTSLNRNPKVLQMHEDLNPDNVMNGIDHMQSECEVLARNALNAEEGNYILGEDAESHIEQLTNANNDMLQKVTDIAYMVADAVRKAKNDNTRRRKNRREEIYSSKNELLDTGNPELREKYIEKQTLYSNIKKTQNEIGHLKHKINSLGGVDKITTLKDEYKGLIEVNYELYEEVKVLQKNKDRNSRAVNELNDAYPEYGDNVENIKKQILTEKQMTQVLVEEAKDIDVQMQK